MNWSANNAETWQSPDVGQPRWCPTCRTRTKIEDVFQDSMWDTRGEVSFVVTALVCGHAVHTNGVAVMGYRAGVSAGPQPVDPWA